MNKAKKKQTELEQDFIKLVETYCKSSGIRPSTLFRRVGYINSSKIEELLSGTGTISARTMGKVVEEINRTEIDDKKAGVKTAMYVKILSVKDETETN